MKAIPVQWIDQIELVAVFIGTVHMEPRSILSISTDKVPYRGIASLEVEADPELSLESFHVRVEAKAVLIAKLVDPGELP